MSKDKVIIILDSDDEEEEKVVVERRNERKRRQPSPVYTTIIIDSDDEEDAKNKKLEKIIMNNVEKKPKSLQTAANINKLFQKDTRLTNLKKSNVKPRKPQLVPSIELSQIDGSFEETQSSTASTSENVFDENIFDEDIFDDDFSDIDFNFTINSQNSAPPTPTPARTAKKCQEPVPTNKKPQIPEEEDLEYYISFFNKKRKRRSVTNTVSFIVILFNNMLNEYFSLTLNQQHIQNVLYATYYSQKQSLKNTHPGVRARNPSVPLSFSNNVSVQSKY